MSNNISKVEVRNKHILVKIAYKLKAIKQIGEYGKYRVLHPLTCIYLPYLLILFYELSLKNPYYKLSDIFCWW